MTIEVVLPFNRLSLTRMLLTAATVIGLVLAAALTLLQEIYVAPPLLLALSVLPLWEFVQWVPKKNQLLIHPKGLTLERVGRTTLISFSDIAAMHLSEERTGVLFTKELMSRLMIVPKHTKTLKTSLEPFYGVAPEGWGRTLVDYARVEGVFVDLMTESVLVSHGTLIRKPPRRSFRLKRNKKEEEDSIIIYNADPEPSEEYFDLGESDVTLFPDEEEERLEPVDGPHGKNEWDI